METEIIQALRRQQEEPLSSEYRPYPLEDGILLVTMLDVPYYPPYMPDKLHMHNCLEIGICLAGCGHVMLGKRSWPFSAGSVIVAPRGVYHSQQNEGTPLTHWRYVVINDACLARIPERYRASFDFLSASFAQEGLFLQSSADSGIDTVIHMMFDVLRSGDGRSPADLELCVLLMLTQIGRQLYRTDLTAPFESVDTVQHQPVAPALTYIYEHYKEDIHISELARSCSMSESYFRKVFARAMGISPLECLNRYRVHRSLHLLRTTADSIQNIAGRCGFSSIAAFNRNFLRHTGMSPSAWRHSHLNK